MNSPLKLSLLLLGVGLCAGPVVAEHHPMPPDRQKWCAENPKQCEEKKARRVAWCRENPERCEKAKAHREEMRKQCEADTVACEAKKAERRKRHEKFRKQCEADPVACEKKKGEMRQRRHEHLNKEGSAPAAE